MNPTRFKKLSVLLTPSQAVVLWMAAAHQYASFTAYVVSLVDLPDSASPLYRFPEQVEHATLRALQGEARDLIERAVHQAQRDVHFLFRLHQQVNLRLLEAEALVHIQLLFCGLM